MKIKWPEIIMKFGTHKILDRSLQGFFWGGGGVWGRGDGAFHKFPVLVEGSQSLHLVQFVSRNFYSQMQN